MIYVFTFIVLLMLKRHLNGNNPLTALTWEEKNPLDYVFHPSPAIERLREQVQLNNFYKKELNDKISDLRKKGINFNDMTANWMLILNKSYDEVSNDIEKYAKVGETFGPKRRTG